jgi:hypothetical protein
MPAKRIERVPKSFESEAQDEQAFQARVAAFNIIPVNHLADACAAVRRTARHGKHPQRASLPFARGERSGSILNLDVSGPVLDRALLFADRLIRTAEALAWPLQDPPPPTPEKPERSRFRWEPPAQMPKPQPVIARLLVDRVEVEFRIEERMRRIELETSSSLKKRNQYDRSPPSHRMESTGALRFVCLTPHFHWDTKPRVWYDRGRSRVEDKIPNILWRFHQLAARELRVRTEAAEAEGRRIKNERLKRELSIRRRNHTELIEELERQAGAWFRAKLLRRYLRAMRRTVDGGRVEGNMGDKIVDFLLWAEEYLDQLNPLSFAPRNPNHQRDHSPYWKSDEEALKKLLLRIFGCDERLPWKVTPESSADSAHEPTEDDEYERKGD